MEKFTCSDNKLNEIVKESIRRVMSKGDKLMSFYSNENVHNDIANIIDESLHISNTIIQNELLHETFEDTIQHELSHLYDEYKREQSNLNKEVKTTTNRNTRLYQKAIDVIGDSKSTKKQYEAAYAIYYVNKSEQIGFINGLDAMLDGFDKKFYKNIEFTEVGRMLDFLNRFISNIEEYSDIVTPTFGISVNRFNSVIKNGYKGLIRRVGGVLARHDNFKDGVRYIHRVPEDLRHS